MPKTNEKYFLSRDEDSHWYIVPQSKREEWEKYMEEIYEYWDPCADRSGDIPQEPDGVTKLGMHFSRVIFSDWEIF